jgi:beta-lactamase class A
VRAHLLRPFLLLLVALPILTGLTACDPAAPTIVAFLERTSVPRAGAVYSGHVTPVAAGTRVTVQRLAGSVWFDIASAAVTAGGNYRVTVPASGTGPYPQRVVSRNTAGQQQAVSRTSQYGTPPAGVLPASMSAWLRGRTGGSSVALYDATTGVTSYYGTNLTYDCASIAKVSILGTVLRSAAVASRPVSDLEWAHANPMITSSSNADATWLWDHVGRGPAVAAYQRSVGMNATVQVSPDRWGLATTTAADQARAVEAITWDNPLLRPVDQVHARGLMQAVVPAQRWGVSAGAPAGATVEIKNGWLPYAGAYRVNSIGHIVDATHNYVIAVLTTTPGEGSSSFTYGIATIEGVSRLLWGQSPTSSTLRVAPELSDAGR